MKKLTTLLAVMASMFVFAVPRASANTIMNLGTGVADWTYSYPYSPVPNGLPATGTAQIVTPTSADWGPGWFANSANSSWIAPDQNVADNGAAPYSFSLTFNLTGYQLSTVAITGGAWAIDDSGTLALNSCSLGSLDDGWSSFSSFSIPNGCFNQGLNTLTMTITESDQNLEGVNLEGTLTGTPITSTPEPTSALMLAIGLGALALVATAPRRARA